MIRKQYETHGVEGYYRQHGAEYQNPHFPQVRELLVRNQPRLDYSKALDFCCGAGEVTLVLRELGFAQTSGCDPFTAEAYLAHTGLTCLPWSFQDVIQGKLTGSYSCIIASFALHLCPPKQLFPLVSRLAACAPVLAVITPHKRPDLSNTGIARLLWEDFALTERGKKVRLLAYAIRGGG